MNTNRIDWIELELSQIVDRYGWAATLAGLQSLLPLGETLADILEAIEDQAVEDLTEQAEYIRQADLAGYRSDCF
jgi:hypothetical protein